MQNSKVKIQKYKSKFKIIFYFLIAIFTFAFLIFNLSNANAQSVRDPIPELGNCRNQQECYLYCQIPQNTPACWSYGKYVMKSEEDVLGETSINITYPIAELGNCSDANACFIYCNQPKNQSTCYAYAKNHGLINEEEIEQEEELSQEKMQEILNAARTELGCESKKQCMSICTREENYAKCEAFAKKHNLYRGPPSIDERGGLPPAEILEKAKTELGCTTARSCMEFCNKPENVEKCMNFARKNKLMREDEYEMRKKEFDSYKEQKEKMLEEAKTELGCDSYESCAKFCGDPKNVEKCMTLGRRHDMGPPPSSKPCTSEAECRAYCEKNPQECKGYQQKMEVKSGEFLGPAGCRTEGECKSYCEKHPDECPGFPKQTKEEQKITPPEYKPPEYER